MSIPNQFSMPAKVNYTPGNDPDGILNFNLDIDPSRNKFISVDVFQQGLTAFLTSGLSQENISYTFDKKLLLILLCFEDCVKIKFYNFTKPDGTQSLAAVAVDKIGTPIGWDPKKGAFGAGGNDFVGADFAHTTSLSAAKGFLKTDANGATHFDFAGFITSVK